MEDFIKKDILVAKFFVICYHIQYGIMGAAKAPTGESIQERTVERTFNLMNAVEEKATNLQKQSTAVLNREEVLHKRALYRIIKRIQDVVLSALALIVLFPIMLIVALIIVIDSPGASPIFSQTRISRDGKPFTFYKFRSMYPDAEKRLNELLHLNEMDGPVFKIKDDPRITRVGRFIRKTSIDELPQLWNVLKGDMSLVGPRPGLPREVEEYDDYAKQRLWVEPGLTCYWQVQHCRNDLSFEQWMKLDVQYIQDRSFTTDWKIIFKTFGAVLGMDGE